MGVEEDLAGLKRDIASAKEKASRAEFVLEELDRKEFAILAELTKMGVEPDSVADEIVKSNKQIQAWIREIRSDLEKS